MADVLSDLERRKGEGYYDNVRPEMHPYVPAQTRRLLEFGCGEGRFGAAIKAKLGCEVWGAELSPIAAAEASSRLDRVLCGDCQQLASGLPDGYFDCVVFNDVLEHLVDPYGLLATIKRKLVPNGAVVASIPNVFHWSVVKGLMIHRDWRYEDVGVMDKTHLRFFTKKSIVRMFETLGYRVERIDGIHPLPSWKLRTFNALTFGLLDEARYLQYACLARSAAGAAAPTAAE